MKIRKSLPKLGEQFNFDAPIYSILKPTKTAFLLLSAFTVFLGVRSQIADYLPDSAILAALILAFAFGVFSFAPDLLNSKLTAFITALILEKRFKPLDIALLIFSLALITALSLYSFKMSRNSADAAHNRYKLKPELIDTKSISAGLDNRLARIDQNYKTDQAEIKQRYATTTATINAKYQNKIEPYRAEIKRLEQLRTPQNTNYITKKQAEQREQIRGEQSKQAAEIQTAQAAEQSELNAIKVKRDKTEQEHAARTDQALTAAEQANAKETAKADKLNSITNTLFTSFAGYAIFIVIVLTILQKVIEHRNEINPVAEISQTDFQFNVLADLVQFPARILGRYTINFVYGLYNALPDLKKVKKQAEIINYQTDQKIIPLRTMERQRPAAGYRLFTEQPEQTETEQPKEFSERRRIGYKGVTDQKGVLNTQGEKDTNLRLLESRLKQYQKRLGVSERKKRHAEKQGKQVNGNTLKSIENNAAWIEHYTGLIEQYKAGNI